jgi:hypothetical protein
MIPREFKMEYVEIPGLASAVSRIGLGTWAISRASN